MSNVGAKNVSDDILRHMSRCGIRYCLPDSLNPDLAKGTIVLCDGLSDGEPVVAVGAAGAILHEDRLRDVALSFPLPASYLGSVDGGEVYGYINTTRCSFSSQLSFLFNSQGA